MNIKKLIGIVLVSLGVLALVYKGFTYTKETHKANLGPFDFAVKEKDRVELPAWAGVAAIAAGVALLVFPLKRDR